MIEEETTRCGFVAIIGRPNVGKSTLLNALLGQKISITSKKPQTTRQRIRGIKTKENCQAIYVDTPGIHKQFHHQLNKSMNNAAWASLRDVDVILFVIEALRLRDEEQEILNKITENDTPIILVINKVDLHPQKEVLLPFLAKLQEQYSFAAMIPVSAEREEGIEAIEKVIFDLLPSSPFFYPAEQVTDSSERFMCSEIVREKLTRLLGQELPYVIAIEITQFHDEGKMKHISFVIWVAKENQKSIVIGENGQKLKKVGESARRDLEKLLKKPCYLNLWVKVKENWYDNTDLLNQFGYDD